MTAITETETYSSIIEEALIAEVQRRVAIINRRAEKIGVPTAEVTFGTPFFPEWDTGEVKGVRRKLVEATITSDIIRYEGWAFVATIEWVGDKNLIKKVPFSKDTDLTEFQDADTARCDHCNVRRKRSKAFILEHEDGRLIQVGGSCAKDFLGIDPTRALYWSEKVDGPFNELPSGPAYLETESFLALIAALIREDGWISRGAAAEAGGIATVDVAMRILFPRIGETSIKIEVTDADKEEARATIEWAANLDARNDYLHNVQVVCSEEDINRKFAAIAASAVAAYQREQDRLREAERKAKQNKASDHQGVKGERIDLTLTVDKVNPIPGFRDRYTYVTTLLDAEGNVFTWFASKRLEVGQTYSGKATIRDHTVFRDIKQTVITRFTAK